MERCQIRVKSALASKQQPVAMSYLRSKRALEDVLAKRVASSEQLSMVIRNIDQAKGDVEVKFVPFLVYKSALILEIDHGGV